MRAARAAAGIVALVLALALGLLADDVRRWPDRLESGDLQFRSLTTERNPWPESRSPLAPVSRRLLGIDDDVKFRGALALLRTSRAAEDPNAENSLFLRAQSKAETALAGIEETDPEPARRSLVANVLGILYYRDSLANLDFIERSLEAFQRSVRANPANVHAKYNLELLLRFARPRLEWQRSRRGVRGRIGGNQAGASGLGEGY